MAGQVLDISKHEHGLKPESVKRAAGLKQVPGSRQESAVVYYHSVEQNPGRSRSPLAFEPARARIYCFPSPKAAAQPMAKDEEPAVRPKSRFRLHRAVEFAIGFGIWLAWFLWRHLR